MSYPDKRRLLAGIGLVALTYLPALFGASAWPV